MFVVPALDTFPDAAPIEASAQADGSYVFRDEAILGTRMQINLVARNYSDALAAAINARNEIDRLNKILNDRDASSELYALNRSTLHHASPELFEVIAIAERWRSITGNAFSGRLGHAIALWQNASTSPDRAELARLAQEADSATVILNSQTRTIVRPDEVSFALDALSKGWIVDHAFQAALTSPGIGGALVDIGGDIRCGGCAPHPQGWFIGIPNPIQAIDNAPLVATTYLSNQAIATSGRGVRDRLIDGVAYSSTLSPIDGWPIERNVSVTTTNKSAADADALATALLVLPKVQGVSLADKFDSSARIQARKEVTFSRAALADNSSARFTPIAQRTKSKGASDNSWPKDWQALITFTAPPRQLVRDEHFRAPYMAMWISDLDNKPIRTLLLVGLRAEWQKDNYIWWELNDENVQRLLGIRSMSTSGSGIYKVLWDGTDDFYKPVPAGNYILHIETSRERGRHTHRSLTLDFTKPKEFTEQLPSTEEAGGVRIDFHHL